MLVVRHRPAPPLSRADEVAFHVGYTRVSTDGQSVAAQVAQLKAAGCGKVFREVACGAKTDRSQLRRAFDRLAVGDVLG
jgi:DNA invertase Pin-like site-specific DNA recombinase